MIPLLSLFTTNVWGASVTLTLSDNSTDTWTNQGASGGGTAIAMYDKTVTGISLSGTSGYCRTSDNYTQIYSGSDITITSTVGNMTSVAFTCTGSNTNNYSPSKFALKSGSAGSYSQGASGAKVGTWTGNASTFTLHANAQVRVTQIVVTYTAAATPSITPSVSELDWGTVAKGASLTTKTFTITGTNLTSAALVYSASGGYSVSPSGKAGAAGALASQTLTVTPPSTATPGTYNSTVSITGGGLASAVTVNVKLKVENTDTFIDEVQSTSGYTSGSPHIEQGSYSTPSLSDKSVATSGTCEQLHYHFVGWITAAKYEAGIAIADGDLQSPTSATGATYYAVWAKQGVGGGSGYEYIGDDGLLEEDETYIFVSSKSAGTAYALKASDLPSSNNNSVTGVSVTVSSAGGKVTVATTNTNLEFTCTYHSGDWDDLEEVANSGRLLVINGNGIGYAGTGKSWYDADGLYGCNSKCNTYYGVYHDGTYFTSASGNSSRVYAFVKQSVSYTDYIAKCCTKLGSINGSMSLTQGGNSVTISGWTYDNANSTTESNVSSYTVKLYKKNGASWDLVSGSTSGGSAGTQGTRTGITSGSKSVTYTGLVVESEYKFTVQAIAGSASYCDGDETAVTTINSTSVSSTPFKFRYAIYIDDGTNDNYEYHYITPTGNTDEGSVDIDLTAHITSYQFKIAGGFSGWWGQTGTSNIPASTKWTLNGSNNVKLNTGAGGTYTFTVDYSGTTNPGVTVTFPSANQASGYKIYFDKSIIDGWGNTLKYRIGNNTDNQNQNFTLVTGTDNFYVTTTPSYNSMDAWQIANNTAWTPGDHDAAHGIYNYHHGDDYDITKATVYFDYVVDGDITMVPSSKKNTENGCDFWYTNKTDGMLTHTATITAPSNGTINLAYTNTSGTSCPTNTSTIVDLAHRTILTATATPATGYQLSTFTVTPSGESAQNLSSGDNHILAKDATFAATFAAKTYAISLDRNGGTTGATEVTMTYNSSSFTGWSAPSRTGYTFDGYYTTETDDNGSGTLVINSSGVLQANVDGYTGANGIWTKDATCTLYAKWTANTTTITLTAGTGTNGSASINYDATSYTSFSAAVRVGYTCTGYWTNTGGTGTKILNANGSFAASTISGYVTSDKWSYTTASTLTLYAGWTNTYAGYAFDLLEDVRDISAGSKIILIGTNAAGDTYKAMTTAQGENNRGSVAAGSGEFVMSNSNKTATLGASTSVQVITLEDLATPADNTYQFNVENGYLYAAGTSNARLKTQTPNSAYGHWLVAVDANTKKATMTGQGGNSYNKIYYNNSSSIFAGYSNAQQPTYIYFNETRTKYTITWDKNGHGTAPTYPTNAARVTMPDISVTGYTNTGWKADKAVTNVSTGATISAGTKIDNDTRVQLSANTTFTAQWSTDVYTISATLTNISVNSAFPSSFTYTGETTTDLNRTLGVGANYALPASLTVTMGGNACTNGTEYSYDSGTGAFTFNVVITGNIVITGTALNKYTLTLNPGNGSLTEGGGWSADGNNLVQVVVEGNNVTLPTPTPSCAGWVFKGWKLGSAADNQSSFTPDKTDGATFAPNATSTYYAVYRASTPTGTTYTKITDEAELETGDYAIVAYSSSYYAMGNSISSSHMAETTAANNSWTNSNADYIWNIVKIGDKVGFYNDDESKFLTIVNGAWVLATEVQWYTYSFNNSTKAWTFTSPSGKQIGYDTWFNVRDAQDDPVYLYKRGNTESGNYYTSPSCSGLTVTGTSAPVGAANVTITATTALSGDKIWAYYTLNRGYSFNRWDKSGTGATLSSTSTQLTRLTVGSTNAAVTAVCDALTSYTLNYHDGEGNHTMTVYEGEKILEILPEPSESCDDESTTFVGWSTTEITTKTDIEPTFVSSSAVINSTTAASTYYAVYAKATGGANNETLSCTAGTIESSQMIFNTTNFTFVHKQNGSGTTISSQSPWRVYEQNTVEISGSLTITGLDIVHSSDYYGNLSSDKGTLTLANTSDGTTTVRDINSTSVTILNASSAKQSRWSSIKVYYTTLSYSKYITTCCNTPTLAFAASPYAVLREDIQGASTTTWAEVDVTFTSNSTGTISAAQYSNATVTNGTAYQLAASKWQVYETTGGTLCGATHAYFEVLTQPSGETPGTGKFHVKTAAGQTGQGTYRIAITQAATDAEHGNYCETTVYGFVDVTLRDKFVDNVNGNGTVNRDGHGAQLATPTLSEFGTQVEDACHSEGRKLKGWIKETDLKAQYETGNSTRVQTIDGLCESCDPASDQKSLVVAPGDNITTSGATWYAVWAYEK